MLLFIGISSVLNNPENYPDHFSIVNGSSNSESDALRLKANNRVYKSQGVQTKLDYHWSKNNIFHDLEIGFRYHYDEEDRFQWVDGYNIADGQMNITSRGARGSNANRISSAKAFASSVLYKLKYDQLTITPGIRYENINLNRKNLKKVLIMK